MLLKYVGCFIVAYCLLSKQLIAQTFSKETIVITTSYGNMKLKLFNETPKHRDNFISLIKSHFYDSLLFHRVIEGFMIQGGDPDSKYAETNKLLGDGNLKYTIPAEFVPDLCHKKGMLCAARNGDDVNPTKASSACQFYLVQGKVRNDNELKAYEKRINQSLINALKQAILSEPENKLLNDKINYLKALKDNDSLFYYNNVLTKKVDSVYVKSPHYTFSLKHQQLYKTLGGMPHLDTNYTIFGEIIEGFDVIDKIAQVSKNQDGRPLADIRMTISITE